MIFTEPFILVSEVFQHVVLIVLAGYLTVELLAGHGKNGVVLGKPKFCPIFKNSYHEVLWLLVTAVVVGSMLMLEYFFKADSILLNLLYHIPGIIISVFVLLKFIPILNDTEVIMSHSSILIIFTSLFLLLSIEVLLLLFDMLFSLMTVNLLHSVLNTLEVIILYIFTLKHISIDCKKHKTYESLN